MVLFRAKQGLVLDDVVLLLLGNAGKRVCVLSVLPQKEEEILSQTAQQSKAVFLLPLQSS